MSKRLGLFSPRPQMPWASSFALPLSSGCPSRRLSRTLRSHTARLVPYLLTEAASGDRSPQHRYSPKSQVTYLLGTYKEKGTLAFDSWGAPPPPAPQLPRRLREPPAGTARSKAPS